MECILCEEKLVHLTFIVKEKEPKLEVPYVLKEEIAGLVQKINRIAMENIKESTDNTNARFISKAVDLVMLPEASKEID